jgi:hypothetical protein
VADNLIAVKERENYSEAPEHKLNVVIKALTKHQIKRWVRFNIHEEGLNLRVRKVNTDYSYGHELEIRGDRESIAIIKNCLVVG